MSGWLGGSMAMDFLCCTAALVKKGASSGIGTETTRVLALRGVHVIMGSGIWLLEEMSKTQLLRKYPLPKLIPWNWTSVHWHL
uniref:Uncharacterized protein n=1 Tax=Populus trichocarpa TaxID=3694 RepID=U5FUD7_POPTR